MYSERMEEMVRQGYIAAGDVRGYPSSGGEMAQKEAVLEGGAQLDAQPVLEVGEQLSFDFVNGVPLKEV